MKSLGDSVLAAILLAAPDGILVVDEGLIITQANPAAEDLFGWSRGTLAGQPISCLVPPAATRHNEHAARFFDRAQGQRHVMLNGRVVSGLRRDGSSFPVRVALARASAGARQFAVAMISDVTEIEALGIELRNRNMELAEQSVALHEATASKKKFISGVSHELRTPLNAIIGFSELLASDASPAAGPARVKEYASHILEGGQRLLSLVNSLIDISRLQRDSWELHLENISVENVLRAACQTVRGKHRGRGPAIIIDCDADLPAARADQDALELVLIQLLDNAAKFSPADKPIHVSARKAGDALRISIADEGCGIPADIVKAVGQPFVGLPDEFSGRSKGLGIGLAITKQLISKMHGSLEIESAPGRGTRIDLQLPTEPARESVHL